MTQEQILALETTKTEKIKRLLELGLTRKQVATLMGIGYGFVQNVYAKHFSTEPNTRLARNTNFTLMAFERRFGVEIEAFLKQGSTKEQLKNAIKNKGINCELQNYNHELTNCWKIVTDSSINANGGVSFELVSPILQGQAGLEDLKKVCEALKEMGARINKTCGLHIHFDAEGFSLQTWKNLLINYANLENTIDKFMPASRREDSNTYCKSLKSDIRRIKKLSALVYVGNLFVTRYKKINTHSYIRHKTVEFRQHSGTVEFEKIKNWIVFLHNLVSVSEIKVLTNTNLESLSEFNQAEIVAFYAERTEELN